MKVGFQKILENPGDKTVYMLRKKTSLTPTIELIYTTISSQEAAEKLAEEAVSLRYAGCVNLIPKATSVYQWEGKLEKSQECLVIFKTSVDQKEALCAWLLEHHPYTLPALLMGEIESSQAFKNHIVHQTSAQVNKES